MSGKCVSCGADTERQEGYMVCVGCGLVDETVPQLDSDAVQELRTGRNTLFIGEDVSAAMRSEISKSQSSSHVTPIRKLAIDLAETLASNLKFTSEMKAYLMNLYMQAINHKQFYNCSLKNKNTLAAVCAYITLLNHSQCVTIRYMCNAFGCDSTEFGSIRNQFYAAFPDRKPNCVTIEEMVRSMLNELTIDKREFSKLKDRVIELIPISRECWLTDGRSPIHIINAITYFAWKSLQPSIRRKLTLQRVCQTLNMSNNLTTKARVKELNDTFIRLAKQNPMLKNGKTKIDKWNVVMFIDDIVNNYSSLIYDLKLEQNNSSELEFFNSFNRKVNYKKLKHKPDESDNKNSDEDEHISDTEIDSYLRSPGEVDMIRKLRILTNID